MKSGFSILSKITLLVLVVVALANCNKKTDVVSPLITSDPFEAAPLDTVKTDLVGVLKLNGKEAKVDTYTWKITGPNGNPVPVLATTGETVTWIPVSEGIHIISVILESGKKSVQVQEQILVRDNVKSIHKLLAGSWNVTCSPTYSGYWEATLSIEADGYYTAHVTSGSAFAFLDNGDDTFEFAERKIMLYQVNDLGHASGDINFMHSGGNMMTYPVCELTLSADYSTAHFWVGWNGDPKMVEYTMTRQ